jgi:hypothetical protein
MTVVLIRVVIKDGHGGKGVLYGRDEWTDVSYWMDLVDIFFKYSLKIYKYL